MTQRVQRILRRAGRPPARSRLAGPRAEAGMTTAEYAVGTLAAVAFAVVLMAIVRSDGVRSALTGVITSALGMGQ